MRELSLTTHCMMLVGRRGLCNWLEGVAYVAGKEGQDFGPGLTKQQQQTMMSFQ